MYNKIIENPICPLGGGESTRPQWTLPSKRAFFNNLPLARLKHLKLYWTGTLVARRGKFSELRETMIGLAA